MLADGRKGSPATTISSAATAPERARQNARLTAPTSRSFPFPFGLARDSDSSLALTDCRGIAGLVKPTARAFTFIASWLTIWSVLASSGWLELSLPPLRLSSALRRFRNRAGRFVAPLVEPDGLGRDATVVVRFGLGVPFEVTPSEGDGAPLRWEARGRGEEVPGWAGADAVLARMDLVSQKT